MVRFYKFSYNATDIIAAIVIAVLILCAILGYVFITSLYNWDGSCYGSFISGVAAIANAILLYLTLRRQGRSFKQERFETTFFNLLSNHEKVVERLFIEKNNENDNGFTKNRQIFDYILQESKLIKIALSSEKYLGQDTDIEELGILYWEEKQYQTNKSEKQKLCKEHINASERNKSIKFYNAKFHITEKLYNKYNSLTDQTTKDLFCNKIVFKYYEPYMINYLHSIKEILKYTNDYIYRKKSISRYMNIFITSMSYKELFFIQNYAKYNKRFGKCIETCKLDKIIEAELSNK